jgi:transcriptional regulator with XRE-family HTH domain
MARDFNDFIASLPQEEQEAIQVEASRLINEEMTLRELRKAREYSQQLMAELLHVNQAAVSKIEHRTDMYISTLRSFVAATGGSLELVATYPDRPPVKIKQFEDLEEPSKAYNDLDTEDLKQVI